MIIDNLSAQPPADTTLPGLIPYRKGQLWGFCDKNKQIVISAEYAWVQPFHKNHAIVYFDNEEKGKHGVIDSAGNKLFSIGKDTMITIRNDGMVIVEKGFYNVLFTVDRSGKRFSSKKYRIKWPFAENSYVATKGKRYGVIDVSGNIIIPFKYFLIGSQEDNDYVLTLNRKKERQFISIINGRVIPSFGKDISAWWFVSENRLLIGKGPQFHQLYGIGDTTGKIIVTPKYKILYGSVSGALIAGDSIKYGLVNTNGDTVLPFNYSMLRQLSKNRLAFTDSLGSGIMDQTGKEFFRMKDKWGYNYFNDLFITYDIYHPQGHFSKIRSRAIDINGKEVLPGEYQFLTNFGPGVINVIEENGKSYYMDYRFNKYYED